ncbi:MAG: OsmC family protein [Akkermansia sp.]|nr:OsmC family protein [Akkermansia sp.]
MSTSVTIHDGDMRCRTVWEPSGQECITDVGSAAGGKGEYPSPAAMMAAAVSSCMLSMIAWTGNHKGFETRGVHIAAGYETDDKGAITALTFDVSVPVPTSPANRRMMEKAAENCPVGAIIAPSVEKKITWNWSEC